MNKEHKYKAPVCCGWEMEFWGMVRNNFVMRCLACGGTESIECKDEGTGEDKGESK